MWVNSTPARQLVDVASFFRKRTNVCKTANGRCMPRSGVAGSRRRAHDRLMTVPSQTRIELVPFCREDFDRLISWLPTEDGLIAWCAAFFSYPLTHAQLERYLESAKVPNARLVFTACSIEHGPVGHIE